MTNLYRVRIFESELRVICDETLSFPDIETGGNLYGSLTHGGAPVVSLATRPAGTVHRGATSLELDHKVQHEIEESLWRSFGIQFLGMWHSHHQIGLYEPSQGDRHRTAGYAASYQRKFYVEILCNLSKAPHSMRTRETSGPEDTPSGKPTGREEHEDNDQPRKIRWAQVREERRRARDPGNDGTSHQMRSSGQLPAWQVRVAPFVYVDATRLERGAAEFVVLPGASPVRTALMMADVPAVLRDAFMPVSGDPHRAFGYELATSPADGGVSQAKAAAPAAEEPGGGRQEVQDAAVVAIPDIAQYVEAYIEPLMGTRPEYPATLEPLDSAKLALRVSGRRRRDAELLMLLGWDGAAPTVLSCAILVRGKAVRYPEDWSRRDIRRHFYWGIDQL